MYISAASSISFQNSFRNKGFSDQLLEMGDEQTIIYPDYSPFIPAMDRRRMSEGTKMSVACAIDCLSQINLQQPDAVIVGTALGSSNHTKKFLDKIASAEGGLISPTSFIQSTHNTFAGQISLLLKNHGYNTTHTQNSLSFEQALIDSTLCIGEGAKNVLVGGVDENEPILYHLPVRLKKSDIKVGYGASFFVLSLDKKDDFSAKLLAVESYSGVKNVNVFADQVLQQNEIKSDEIDLVLYSSCEQNIEVELSSFFPKSSLIDFQKYCGVYLSNSSFALHLAFDFLQQEKGVKTVLVYNNLISENLGLLLLKRV